MELIYNRTDERRRNFMLILCRAYCNFFLLDRRSTDEKRSELGYTFQQLHYGVTHRINLWHVKSPRSLWTNFFSEDAFAHHHRHNHPNELDLRYWDAIELESHPALTKTSYHDAGEPFWTTEPNLCGESLIEIDCFDQASSIEDSSTENECNVCHELDSCCYCYCEIYIGAVHSSDRVRAVYKVYIRFN
ncbi:unnamed protein product, partial [Trichogramma brassicae]